MREKKERGRKVMTKREIMNITTIGRLDRVGKRERSLLTKQQSRMIVVAVSDKKYIIYIMYNKKLLT